MVADFCLKIWIFTPVSSVQHFSFLSFKSHVLGSDSFSSLWQKLLQSVTHIETHDRYYKVWLVLLSVTNCDRYYNMWQEVITKCGRYWKIWKLLQRETHRPCQYNRLLLKCKFLEIVGPDGIYFLSCSFTQQIILDYLVGLVSCLSIESRLQIYLLFIVVCPSISRAFISMLGDSQPRECCTQWY